MIKAREVVEEKVSLPIRWPRALDKFAAGAVLPDYLGQRFCEVFVACRREEEDRFHSEVTNSDYDWYLRSA
jgi:glutamine synthetase